MHSLVQVHHLIILGGWEDVKHISNMACLGPKTYNIDHTNANNDFKYSDNVMATIMIKIAVTDIVNRYVNPNCVINNNDIDSRSCFSFSLLLLLQYFYGKGSQRERAVWIVSWADQSGFTTTAQLVSWADLSGFLSTVRPLVFHRVSLYRKAS
jgi:hypothetical protein